MSKFINLKVDFDKEIVPLLKEVNRTTSNSKFSKKDIKIFFIFVVCSILGTFLAYLRLVSTQGNMQNLLAAGVVIVIFGVGLLSMRNKKIEDTYKAYIFDKLLDKFNLEYFNSSSESRVFGIDDSLFPVYDYVRIDDGFSGYEKGFFVSILELSLHSVPLDTPDTAKFKGVLLEYRFEEISKNDLYILLKPKKYFDFSKKPDLIKLENTLKILDKEYEIFTNDKEKAKEFLTPIFLEKLSKTQEYFGVSSLFCSVMDNSCMLALPTNRDFFKLNNFELKAFRRQFNTLLKELQNISVARS